MKKISFLFYLGLIWLLVLPIRLQAFTLNDILGKPGEQLDKDDIITIIGNVLQILIDFAAAVCMIFVIIGGYHYITSGGNEEKISQAKATLTWAIAGFIIALGAWAFMEWFKSWWPSTTPVVPTP